MWLDLPGACLLASCQAGLQVPILANATVSSGGQKLKPHEMDLEKQER